MDSENTALEIVGPCGSGKSTSVIANLIKAASGLKFVVIEPRVLVARNNAIYMAQKLGVKAKFIIRGVPLDSAHDQPPNTVIYFSTGKYRQLLKAIRACPNLVEKLCVVISDWHVRDSEYAMLITETALLLKGGMNFKLIFTSAFALCEKWKKDIDLGNILFAGICHTKLPHHFGADK